MSALTVNTRKGRLWPMPASAEKSRLVPAERSAPTKSVFRMPILNTTIPPMNVPTKVIRNGGDFFLGKAHIPIERVAHDAHDDVTDPVRRDQEQDSEGVPAISIKEVRNRPNADKTEPADYLSDRTRK